MSRMKLIGIEVAEIKVSPRHRKVRDEDVDVIADSMKCIGLKTPITVHRADRQGAGLHIYRLITGAHRLAAAQKLGWEKIDAFVTSDKETPKNLSKWEIAENLHRAELTVLERSEHIAAWLALSGIKGEQVAHPLGGVQPADKGISLASKELGIDRAGVRRAIKINSLSPEAKSAARQAGVDNNQTVLIRAAKVAPEDQETEVVSLGAQYHHLYKDEPVGSGKVMTGADFHNTALEGAIKEIDWLANKYHANPVVHDALVTARRTCARHLKVEPPDGGMGLKLVT